MAGKTTLGFEVLEGRAVPAQQVAGVGPAAGAGGQEPAMVGEANPGGGTELAAAKTGWDLKTNKPTEPPAKSGGESAPTDAVKTGWNLKTNKKY